MTQYDIGESEVTELVRLVNSPGWKVMKDYFLPYMANANIRTAMEAQAQDNDRLAGRCLHAASCYENLASDLEQYINIQKQQ